MTEVKGLGRRKRAEEAEERKRWKQQFINRT
jgi:hypothetical protein